MISLKQIAYALAVERSLHFKKAAEDCAVSQSALSSALSEMEKQLGFQIFERDNRKVLVTPLGQQVLDKARSIKVQVDDIHKLAESLKAPLSTPLSIGVIPTIGPYLLPRVLPLLEAQYPGLKLDVVEDQSAELLELVRRGELDAAILALPYDCEGLLAFKFWEEDFYWITAADDELSNYEVIGIDELEQTRLMLLKQGHCLTDHALAACKLAGAGAHSLSATSLATLIQLVAGKMGTTLVPEMALEQLVDANPALARVPLQEPGPHREIAFVVRPNYPALANLELLMQLFRGELERRVSKKRG